MGKGTRNSWQRSRRLVTWIVLIWAVLVLGIPAAALHLEAIAVMGLPLGYYAGAQGLLIAIVILAFVSVLGRRSIERRPADHERGS